VPRGRCCKECVGDEYAAIICTPSCSSPAPPASDGACPLSPLPSRSRKTERVREVRQCVRPRRSRYLAGARNAEGVFVADAAMRIARIRRRVVSDQNLPLRHRTRLGGRRAPGIRSCPDVGPPCHGGQGAKQVNATDWQDNQKPAKYHKQPDDTRARSWRRMGSAHWSPGYAIW